MTALGIMFAMVGLAMAWGGPLDPDYLSDWGLFLAGCALVYIGIRLIGEGVWS